MITNGSHTPYVCVCDPDDDAIIAICMLYNLGVMITNGSHALYMCVCDPDDDSPSVNFSGHRLLG